MISKNLTAPRTQLPKIHWLNPGRLPQPLCLKYGAFLPFWAKVWGGLNLDFPPPGERPIRLRVLRREGRGHTWYLFLPGVSRSVWEPEGVEIISSPLQLVAGRQSHSIGGIQRAEGEGCYVRASLLSLLLPNSQKKASRWKCVPMTFFSCIPSPTGN